MSTRPHTPPTLPLFRLSLDDCLLRLIDNTFYRIINQTHRWNITSTVCIEFNKVWGIIDMI